MKWSQSSWGRTVSLRQRRTTKNEEESTYGTEKGIDNKLVFLYKSGRNVRTLHLAEKGRLRWQEFMVQWATTCVDKALVR